MNTMTLLLLAGNVAIFGLGIGTLCYKNFRVAVFLIALSPFFSNFFVGFSQSGAVDQEPVIGSYIRICILGLAAVVALFYIMNEKLPYPEPIPFHFICLILFISIAMASTLYSIDQRFSLIRSISFAALACFLLGCQAYLKTEEHLRLLFKILFAAICFYIVANYFALVFFPARAWYPTMPNRFQGFLSHPNTVGSLCMLSYPILFLRINDTRGAARAFASLILLSSLLMHALSGSRGSIIAAVGGIAIWWISMKKYEKVLAYILTIALVLFLVVFFQPSQFQREGNDDISGLSGRTDFWKIVLILISENPVKGLGYGVGGKIFEDPRFQREGYDLWSGSPRSSLHQGYLSIMVELGLIAFLLWCFTWLVVLWRCASLLPGRYKGFVLSTMSMCLVVNLVETAITGGNTIVSIFFWLAWVIGGRLPLILPQQTSTPSVMVLQPVA
jgi:O-antigen ligase